MPDYLFFFGGVFSQWCRCDLVDRAGTHYNCCEQFMMAGKARLFKDAEAYKEIMSTKDPRKQKQLGRKIKDFDQELWNARKFDIVTLGNWYRAKCDSEFATALKNSGDRIIVEASPYDRVWGIGFSQDRALKVPTDKWGENLLGKALMRVRKKLCAEQNTQNSW